MPAPCGVLYWTRSSTQGSAPICPERCPRPPSMARVSISCPQWISPGPISTREPSCVSMNQRPDSGTTHCGFGLSCHSPTQPTGRTVKKTAATSSWDLSHPHRRRLAADALHLESVERAARQAAGAVRRTPQAVVRHLRCPARVAAIVAHGSERRKRHRYLSKVDDEMSLRGPSRCELPLLYRRCWSVLRKASSSAAPSAVPPIRAARSGEGA